ncbi:MAG: glutamate--tRNA ligase family protein [Candidatus Bipolaricaulis sp.]|nr:glutamate--tRNA ligase family protein [Candidatus Bipolaricaulis sp.]
MIRVRFAPSPTGYLHVGGARTALFNWLFARHAGGTFVLRIEDTDRERSTDEAIEQIVDSMRWLGLDWDEYYRQAERHDRHLEAAESLLRSGAVYERDGAWWFRVPEAGATVVHDELVGDVRFDNDQLKDFVIRRSDGTFVYNFVVVVDDVDMAITHVIRGDEHLNNLPKQMRIYEALGHPMPLFYHLPMILGPDRGKLSKRHGATSVLEYRDRGILPEALVNFLVRLGWAHGDEEVFSREDLVRLFTLEALNKSAAVFEDAKLLWLNQQHMKRADLGALLGLVEPLVVARGRVPEGMWTEGGSDRLLAGLALLRDRARTLRDLAAAMEMLFPVPIEREDEATISPLQGRLMRVLADEIERIESWGAKGLEELFRGTLARESATLKDVALACRIAVTGRKAGPGLFEILSAVGPAVVAERLRAYAGAMSA